MASKFGGSKRRIKILSNLVARLNHLDVRVSTYFKSQSYRKHIVSPRRLKKSYTPLECKMFTPQNKTVCLSPESLSGRKTTGNYLRTRECFENVSPAFWLVNLNFLPVYFRCCSLTSCCDGSSHWAKQNFVKNSWPLVSNLLIFLSS